VPTERPFGSQRPDDPDVLITSSAGGHELSVVELRQYTLHPGQRDVLIDLFDQEFVETQEAVGIRVLGQFRDLDNPNRFVWLRAFPDMPARRRALEAFYGGPVWAAYGDHANPTMVDSDDVLLLRPTSRGSGFVTAGRTRSPVGAGERFHSLLAATVYSLPAPIDEEFVTFFAQWVAPEMVRTSAAPVASFQTEAAENTYPGLPVREGEHVFVWFASFSSEAEQRRHVEQLRRSASWNDHVKQELAARLASHQYLRLQPTPRSLLP
jgi:hypothetical protein